MLRKIRAGCACIHSNRYEGSKSDSGKRPGTEERLNYAKVKVPTRAPAPRQVSSRCTCEIRKLIPIVHSRHKPASDRASSGIVFVWHDIAQKTRPHTEIGKNELSRPPLHRRCSAMGFSFRADSRSWRAMKARLLSLARELCEIQVPRLQKVAEINQEAKSYLLRSATPLST
jgi:hypothetical protein